MKNNVRNQPEHPFQRASRAELPTVATPAATAAIVIAALYFGRDILIPLALATLLAFILTPLIGLLRRYWVPRLAAIGAAVTVALMLVALVSIAVGAQLVQLANDLPVYQRNISLKIERLKELSPSDGLVSRVSNALRSLEQQLSPRAKPQPPEQAKQEVERQPDPVPVVVEPPPRRPLEVLQSVAQPLLGPAGTAGLVIVFVIFILLEREELRDRFIKLFGGDDLQRSTQLISDAANRVSGYLLMQLIVNISYGIPVGLGLAIIGVPNAVIWGVLAAVLRFIPYLGPWLAAFFPIVIAVGSEPGWSMVLWTIGLFVVLELLSNNILEPWLYGASTGLSSFAVILAAIFWTVLWGPVGLFLSTPLTVCLVVIGRHVPRLAFLDMLLGSEPVLSPAQRFYQRLLSVDHEEALDLAETEIANGSERAFYDDVALAALIHAEANRMQVDDPAMRRSLTESLAGVLDELEEGQTRGDPVPTALRLACIAGRTELDFGAAILLAHRLRSLGHEAVAHPSTSLAPHAVGAPDLGQVDGIFLCYLSPNPGVYVRHACRRLSRHAGKFHLSLCLFNLANNAMASKIGEECKRSRAVYTSLASAEDSVSAGK